MRDPYDVLGLPRNASNDDIKKAYRRLAREQHPDQNPDNPRAEERFKDLSSAYDLLSDPKKKADYDRGDIDADGNPVRRGFNYGGGNAGRHRNPFDEFLKRQRSRNRANIKVDGNDVSYSLKVDFSEAALGANKHVSMTNGKRLAVSIPPGTRDGQTLRLKGQGMGGIGGGENGDALVEITVNADPLYERKGDDIHLELPISLPEAILGTQLEVPTIHGNVKLNIPKGSNTGAVLRLKGKGIDNPKATTPGNQFVTLKVVLPASPDKELSDFIEKWAKTNDYDVRGTDRKPKKAGA